MYNLTDRSDRNPRQFGLRVLFGLTLVAAILARMAIVFRDSRYFHALWSPHALIAALPICGVFVVHFTTVRRGRGLAVLSLAIFGVALVTPALRLGGDLVFGWVAFLLSFLGIGLFQNWESGGERFWYPIACTMGALANLSFIVGYVAYLTSLIWHKGIRLSRWSATLGSCLSLSVIVPLALSTELNRVYLGHGLWTTSLLALALGSWGTTSLRVGPAEQRHDKEKKEDSNDENDDNGQEPW
jgi:hypothetical protein